MSGIKIISCIGTKRVDIAERKDHPTSMSIEAMFLAEVKNLLLTAGHDLDRNEGNLTVDIAKEPLKYKDISRREQ